MSTNTAYTEPLILPVQGEPTLSIIGLNYKSCPLELREKFALSLEKEREIATVLKPYYGELVLLSTCNRMEIIFTEQNSSSNSAALCSAIAGAFHVSKKTVEKLHYRLREREAVTHIFSVACGLDSMVVGEPQIFGQLKRAYQRAYERRLTGSVLNRLFQATFHSAKIVRSRTRIGQSPVSLCYAARELAKEVFGELASVSMLILGTGEIASLALKHFSSAGVKSVFIGSRTLAHAATLAQSANGAALELKNCKTVIPNVDVVVGAVNLADGCNHLVDYDDVKAALKFRRNKPQLYLDLGVPRVFHDAIGTLPNAFLFNIDDLGQLINQNKEARLKEKQAAELIVDEEVEKFCRRKEHEQLNRLMRELQAKFNKLTWEETKKTLRGLRRRGFSEVQCLEFEEALKKHSEALLSKVLHQPLEKLKGEAEEKELLMEIFAKLFLGNGGE